MTTDNKSEATALAVWQAARRAFIEMEGLRQRRERLKGFAYGNQWSDPVRLSDGTVVSEREWALRAGSNPATNNLLRQIVKNVVGRFRERAATESRTRLERADAERNLIDELDARTLEEFLLSGCAVQRVVREERAGGAGVWVDNVSPRRFFVNRHADPRGTDIELVGMLHDMPLAEALARFGGSDGSRRERVTAIFGEEATRRHLALPAGGLLDGAAALWEEADGEGRCRVAEVWTLEHATEVRCRDLDNGTAFTLRPRGRRSATAGLLAENGRRRQAGKRGIAWRRLPVLRWHCRWFGPEGQLLWEHDSPWGHGTHPFVVKMYPLIDSEVHPFLEDMVDQQKHINRLVTLIDHIVGASAKGVLLFPKQALPAGADAREMAESWARPGSVIFYNALSEVKPEVLSSPRNDAAAADLLALEMRMIEQVSGVGSVLQGRAEGSSRNGVAIYQEQVRNAQAGLRDIFDTFESFRRARDAKAAGL